MLQPRRRSQGKWSCKTCGAELGRTKRATGIGTILHPTGLVNARPDATGANVWWLRCTNGHETRWVGEFELTHREAA